MLVRVFRARVKPGKEQEWERQVRELTVPQISGAAGLLDWYPGRPAAGTREYSMVSVWRDLESVQAYNGDDWQAPVLYGEEAELVESVSVEHYEVFGRT